MIILGIETSCDETAVAVAERGEQNRILAEAVKSQIPLHSPYGGIVPEIASRNHIEVIDRLSHEALQASNRQLEEVDLIALTLGPGLLGSLLVGLSFAKGLALAHRLPLVSVDHLMAHIESAFIGHPEITYPLLALVVSGGHTSLFYQKEKFKTQLLAKTRDDAAGEVMDKIAKYFQLGYPGGPILDRLYEQGDARRFAFSFPRMSDGANDFSFSGYKTAVLRHAQNEKIQKDTPAMADLAASFLHSLVEYLLAKVTEAAQRLPVRSLVVAGGVSRNSLLRHRFAEACPRLNLPLYLPEPALCTDNAAMVAWLGYEKYLAFPNLNYFDLYLNAYARDLNREKAKHR